MMMWNGEGWGWTLGLLMVGCWAIILVASVWCLAMLTRSTGSSPRESRPTLHPWSRRSRPRATHETDPAFDRAPTKAGERS